MSNFRNILIDTNSIQSDASSRVRVSQIHTLHDGKIFNQDNTYIFDNQGTGTGTFSNNKYNMSVTSGQYFIKQTRRYGTYSAGKSQIVEVSFDNFQTEANTVKRIGYFSSSAVAPYYSSFDGFWLENDASGTIRIIAQRDGVETINVPITSWDNYYLIQNYDWSKFTVITFDFLWLGGAVLRMFLKTDSGFVLCHTVNYSGTSTDIFIKSPNQPIRSEIRSTTGSGSLRYICSQIATEGSLDECGYNCSVSSLSTNANPYNTLATVGTIYPVKGIRKKSTHRDVSVKIIGLDVLQNAADQSMWMLLLNPICTTPLTYTDVSGSAIQEANGSAVTAITNTVTNVGRVLAKGFIAQNTIVQPNVLDLDFLLYLGCTIGNIMDELVLCVQPISSTNQINACINYKEY